jgi:hypothetical protein
MSLLAGALISGGSALLQGIIGGIQASRANKQFKRLSANRPQYEIPKEYESILGMYKTAMAGNAPGYSQSLANMEQAGARARGAAERGAISSVSYGSQVSDIYQKELDAIQNLGVQQEQWKASQMQNVAGAQAAMGEQKAQQWNVNQYVPWQTEMNRLGEQRATGMQNLFQGIQSGLGGITDLIGTKYYTDAMKGLYQQPSGKPNGTQPVLNYQSPLLGSSVNPQQNMIGTLGNILKKTSIQYPNIPSTYNLV